MHTHTHTVLSLQRIRSSVPTSLSSTRNSNTLVSHVTSRDGFALFPLPGAGVGPVQQEEGRRPTEGAGQAVRRGHHDEEDAGPLEGAAAAAAAAFRDQP